MKKFYVLAIALLMVPGLSHALTQTTAWGNFPSTNFNFPLPLVSTNLAQFNIGGATLISVKLELETDADLTWEVTNNDPNNALTVNSLQVNGTVTATGPSALVAVALPTLVVVTPFNVAAGATVNGNGAASASGSSTLVNPLLFAPYIGAGTVQFDFSGAGGNLSSISGAGSVTSGGSALGRARLVYEYREDAIVPEPATLGLIGLGLSAFGVARRRRRGA